MEIQSPRGAENGDDAFVSDPIEDGWLYSSQSQELLAVCSEHSLGIPLNSTKNSLVRLKLTTKSDRSEALETEHSSKSEVTHRWKTTEKR